MIKVLMNLVMTITFVAAVCLTGAVVGAKMQPDVKTWADAAYMVVNGFENYVKGTN